MVLSSVFVGRTPQQRVPCSIHPFERKPFHSAWAIILWLRDLRSRWLKLMGVNRFPYFELCFERAQVVNTLVFLNEWDRRMGPAEFHETGIIALHCTGPPQIELSFAYQYSSANGPPLRKIGPVVHSNDRMFHWMEKNMAHHVAISTAFVCSWLLLLAGFLSIFPFFQCTLGIGKGWYSAGIRNDK